MIASLIMIRKLSIAAAAIGIGVTVAATAASAVEVTCSGGAVEAVTTKTQNVAVSTSSAALTPVPGTVVEAGPAGVGDYDTYVVTFSGQAFGTGGGFWKAQAQYSTNSGVTYYNMTPYPELKFHNGNGAEANSMTWCGRFTSPSVPALIRIVWSKSGGGTANVDKFSTTVVRYN
jgi:hypothetical protein